MVILLKLSDRNNTLTVAVLSKKSGWMMERNRSSAAFWFLRTSPKTKSGTDLMLLTGGETVG